MGPWSCSILPTGIENELFSHQKKKMESLSLLICRYNLGRGWREITILNVTAEWMKFLSPLNGCCHENQFSTRTGFFFSFFCWCCCFLPPHVQTFNLLCSLCTASCNLLALMDWSFWCFLSRLELGRIVIFFSFPPAHLGEPPGEEKCWKNKPVTIY